MLVAAVEPPRSLESFTAWKVNAAMGAWDHGLSGRRFAAPLPFAGRAYDNVDNDAYRNQKEEFAHAMAADVRRGSRRAAIIPGPRMLVGVTGFEPATPRSRTVCSTRLSYTPNRPRDCGRKSASGTLIIALDREGGQF